MQSRTAALFPKIVAALRAKDCSNPSMATKPAAPKSSAPILDLVSVATSHGFRGGATDMDIHGYLMQIRALAGSGQATEHSYRPAIDGLFKSIGKNLIVHNELKQNAVRTPFSAVSSNILIWDRW